MDVETVSSTIEQTYQMSHAPQNVVEEPVRGTPVAVTTDAEAREVFCEEMEEEIVVKEEAVEDEVKEEVEIKQEVEMGDEDVEEEVGNSWAVEGDLMIKREDGLTDPLGEESDVLEGSSGVQRALGMETLGFRLFRNQQFKNQPKELDIMYRKRFVRWALAPDHLPDYIQGARIWIPHPEKVWIGAKVTEYSNQALSVVTDDNETKELPVKSDDDLPPLRNPDILIGQNDLTSLSYLHEPAVLYNLQVRFCQSKNIYTYCGIVLVAINPYCEVSIYDPGTIWMYRGQNMGDLDPHIFAVAEEAYTKIERCSGELQKYSELTNPNFREAGVRGKATSDSKKDR
ncbi:hypothetical protein GE061_002453 [Apolygus lucorum]|uniref:Myosin motor domain-containing protein n=1 Tax=Apolygus lucorum TaxID=248454 RepID=A0A8S9X578_APOLU|nr:hypothetical protein GE061_002453 [Apolygus lucorum]